MSTKQHFDKLAKAIRFSEAWIVSAMPRGGLQLLDSSRSADAIVKTYGREFHRADIAAWRAILTGRPTSSAAAWPGGWLRGQFYVEFASAFRPRDMAVAPLAAPLLDGYPGALHLFRADGELPFADDEIKTLGEAAAEMSEDQKTARQQRHTSDCNPTPTWLHRTQKAMFIFDSAGKLVYPKSLSSLDERIGSQLTHDAASRAKHALSQNELNDRLSLPDGRGELATFRVTHCAKYEAIGEGSYLFYCLEPRFCDWQPIQTSDFAGDSELARLVPAMQFMQQEYHRGPTLAEISESVHLSPFHFHRRFTDLLGVTPKHFLLESQIFHAKQMLTARAKDLSEIASMCGFAHQSHFTSRFKQATGLTPTHWRKVTGK